MMEPAATRSPSRRRILIDSDAKNEADDQFAIVHALLSPTLEVEGLVAAHFGPRRTSSSMRESRDEIDLILDLLDPAQPISAADGAPHALPDDQTPVPSAGSRLILERSFARERPGPLHLAFLGPLTDLASALLEAPDLVRQDIVVIWVGGPPYDDVELQQDVEFNLSNDIAAANVVFRSGIPIWQIPSNVYQLMGVGYAELEQRVAPHGPIGAYLVQQVKDWNARNVPWQAEFRSLGDSPAIGAVLNPLGGVWRRQLAPQYSPTGALLPAAGGNHRVRVCEYFDSRYLLEDFFAKIRRLA